MKIIGLNGKAGSGKDTLADLLINHKGYTKEWHRYSFANPLRQMLSVGLGINMDIMSDPKKKNDPKYGYMGKSARYLLQTLGTEWGRNLVDQNIWINEFERRSKYFDDNNTEGIIVTDCRFENEADAIHKLGGIVVNITRPNNPYTKKVKDGGVESHLSEKELPKEKIDYYLINDGKPDQLLTNFQKILNSIDLGLNNVSA